MRAQAPALLLAVVALLAGPSPVSAQTAEKQLVITITSEQLKGGVVSEITWDGGTLVMGGIQVPHLVTLDSLVLHERVSRAAAAQGGRHAAGLGTRRPHDRGGRAEERRTPLGDLDGHDPAPLPAVTL